MSPGTAIPATSQDPGISDFRGIPGLGYRAGIAVSRVPGNSDFSGITRFGRPAESRYSRLPWNLGKSLFWDLGIATFQSSE